LIIWLIFFLFLQTKPSFCRLLAAPSWTFLPKYRLSEYTRCGGGRGGMGPQLNLNDIGRNCLLGNRKKIAKFIMRTFACRSTFLYGPRHRLRKSVNKSNVCNLFECPLANPTVIFFLFNANKIKQKQNISKVTLRFRDSVTLGA
jgi:hypothetical protein